MDTQFKLPNGWRFGWDGVIGLLPGMGNVITDGFAFYILIRAAILGVPISVITRMGINILIDNLVDKIPFLGIFLDFFWKANTRNVEILDHYFARPMATHVRSRWILFFSFAFIAGLFSIMTTVTYLILAWSIGILKNWIMS